MHPGAQLLAAHRQDGVGVGGSGGDGGIPQDESIVGIHGDGDDGGGGSGGICLVVLRESFDLICSFQEGFDSLVRFRCSIQLR